jgi:GTP-binding protein Era
MSETAPYRSGYIAIIGRPNVGKSTLLNHLVKHKVSITSSKAQTTRHSIIGILTTQEAQFVFVDTPGFQTKHRDALSRAMHQSLFQSMDNVDVILWVVESLKFTPEDEQIIKLITGTVKPVILVINKVDKVEVKSDLLPFIRQVSQVFQFAAIVPIAAKHDQQISELLKTIKPCLPENEQIFADDEVTNRSEKFLAAELIREKIFRLLGEEIPYSASVVIEEFKLENNIRYIQAAVIVDKSNHKAIVIGKNGEKLKTIGSQARVDMEKLFGGKVFLELWVKIKKGWADDASMIKKLGYE